MAMFPPFTLQPVGSVMHKKVVWLSRGTERKRGLPQEDEILAAIRKVLPDGWTLNIFADGEHEEGFAKIRKFFSTASIVIGPHGGSFANAFFLPRGATVIEINGLALKYFGGSKEVGFIQPMGCFFGLAMTLGLEYRLVSPSYFRPTKPIIVNHAESVAAALPFPNARKLSQDAVHIVKPTFPKGGWSWAGPSFWAGNRSG
eukprot:Hpha_TRINITY_DN15327_c7_g1::TRINITY_DN15327_c7_g1_i2::g.91120::m.91120